MELWRFFPSFTLSQIETCLRNTQRRTHTSIPIIIETVTTFILNYVKKYTIPLPIRCIIQAKSMSEIVGFGKKIYLCGRGNEECKGLPINTFIERLVLSNKPKNIDIFLESPRKLHPFFKKSKCPYPNAQFHYLNIGEISQEFSILYDYLTEFMENPKKDINKEKVISVASKLVKSKGFTTKIKFEKQTSNKEIFLSIKEKFYKHLEQAIFFADQISFIAREEEFDYNYFYETAKKYILNCDKITDIFAIASTLKNSRYIFFHTSNFRSLYIQKILIGSGFVLFKQELSNDGCLEVTKFIPFFRD